MNDPQFNGPMPHTARGGMLRLAAAAKLAGLSRHTLLRGCELGSIPVRAERVGGVYLVRADELAAWLAPQSTPGAPLRGKTPAADLFTE